MKLVRADGHQQQQWALANTHTQTIARILSEHLDDDSTLVREVASVLQKCTGAIYSDLDRKLANIRAFYELSDPEELISVPIYIVELLQALYKLYHQPRNKLYKQLEEQINSLRGAVVELLGLELIKHRYGREDECANSRYFFDQYNKKITLREIDIATLSHARRELEGYECKMKAIALMNDHCTDMEYLYKTAQEEQYQAHVGMISLDPSNIIIKRLRQFAAHSCIQVYGVDMLGDLRYSPFD
jgi:hypothetical protein